MDGVIIGAIIAVGGVVAGALIHAENERTERLRDRMIESADEFLHAIGSASEALDSARWRVRDYATTLDLKPEALEKAAETAMTAIQAAEAEIKTANGLVPRVTVTFPASLTENAMPWAFRVTSALDRKLGVLTLGLSNPPINEQAWQEASRDFSYEQGAFVGYANAMIWRRWFTRRLALRRAISGTYRRIRRARPAGAEPPGSDA